MISAPPPIQSTWSARCCPICDTGAAQMVELGRRHFVVRQRTHAFEWNHVDGVCTGCGLIQGLVAPEETFLQNYYADAHTTRTRTQGATIKPGFDTGARLSTISKFHPGGTLVELGAGDGSFCEILKRNGIYAYGVDHLDDEGSELVIKGDACDAIKEPGGIQTIAAYHVLEHIAEPSRWLKTIRHMLQEGGIIIIEVPDVERWPSEAWHHEHFTQFSRERLQAFHEAAGFETVSCGAEIPSRHHGLVYVGRLTAKKRHAAEPSAFDENHKGSALARALYAKLSTIQGEQAQAAQQTSRLVLETIQAKSPSASEVIIWGANEIAAAIGASLTQMRPELPLRLVDNSETKIGVIHAGFSNRVQRPIFNDDAAVHKIFVLCSRNWNDLINTQIREMGLRSYTILDGTNWPTENKQ